MGRLLGHRRQKAVYWANNGRNEYGVTVAAGVELTVRWVEKTMETLDANNETIRTDVMLVLDQDVEMGSIFWKGELDDLPAEPTPLFQVISKRTTPNVKGTRTRYRAFLIRYGSTLPTIV